MSNTTGSNSGGNPMGSNGSSNRSNNPNTASVGQARPARRSNYTPISPLQLDQNSVNQINRDIDKILGRISDRVTSLNNDQLAKSTEYFSELDKMSKSYHQTYTERGVASFRVLEDNLERFYQNMNRLSQSYWSNYESQGKSVITNLAQYQQSLLASSLANTPQPSAISTPLTAASTQVNAPITTSQTTTSSTSANIPVATPASSSTSESSSPIGSLTQATTDAMATSASSAQQSADAASSIQDSARSMSANSIISARTLKAIGTTFINVFTSVAKGFYNKFSSAMYSNMDAYENMYHEISVRQSYDQSAYQDLMNDIQSTLNREGTGKVTNPTEVMNAVVEVSKQGYRGFDAQAKAYNDTISQKIVPWLDTTSESYLAMYDRFGESFGDMTKGMYLQLKATKAGNKLVERNIYGSLMDSIYPSLLNIDKNTAEEQIGAYSVIAESLVSAGLDPTQASNYAKEMTQAVEAGFVNADDKQLVMLSDMVQAGIFDQETGTIINDPEKLAKYLGLQFDKATKGDYTYRTAVSDSLVSKSLLNGTNVGDTSELLDRSLKAQEAILNNNISTDTASQTYENATTSDNLESTYTATQLANNTLSTISQDVSDILAKLPYGNEIFGAFTQAGAAFLGRILPEIGQILIAKGPQLISSLGSTISGGLSSSTTAILGTVGKFLGPIAGGAMAIADGVKGANNAAEWLGKENAEGSDKLVAAISAALAGTGEGVSTRNGIIENGKVVLSGATKGALIGMIGGPIGSAIGGLAGGLLSAVGGKRLTNAIATARDTAAKSLVDGFSFVKGYVEYVGDGLSDSWESFKSNFSYGVSMISDGFDNFKSKLSDGASVVSSGFSEFSANWSRGLGVINDGLSSVKSIIHSKLSEGWDWISSSADNAKSAWDNFTSNALSSFDSIRSKVSEFKDSIVEFIKGILEPFTGDNSPLAGIKTKWDDAFGEDGSVKQFFSNASDYFKSGLSELKDLFFKSDGSHANGLENVPYDNYRAILHKGEKVLTASDADLLKAISSLSMDPNVVVTPIVTDISSSSDSIAKNSNIDIRSSKEYVPSINITTSADNNNYSGVTTESYYQGIDRLITTLNKGFSLIANLVSKSNSPYSGYNNSKFGLAPGQYNSLITD